jgi:hypothetical protein
MPVQADTIIAFAIVYAIQERPKVVQADILNLMRRQVQLVEENERLRRQVAQLQGAGNGNTPGRRGRPPRAEICPADNLAYGPANAGG